MQPRTRHAGVGGGRAGRGRRELLRAGHLPLDAAALDAALAQGGSAAIVARRLAAQCDAVARAARRRRC